MKQEKFKIGDSVEVIEGAFYNAKGTITSLSPNDLNGRPNKKLVEIKLPPVVDKEKCPNCGYQRISDYSYLIALKSQIQKYDCV
jgi:hypothetical protein